MLLHEKTGAVHNTEYKDMYDRDIFFGVIREIRDTNLATTDYGYDIVKDFINKYPHDDFKLTINNRNRPLHKDIVVECITQQIPGMVSAFYRAVCSTAMYSIVEDKERKSYNITLCYDKDIVKPGVYVYRQGRLFNRITGDVVKILGYVDGKD